MVRTETWLLREEEKLARKRRELEAYAAQLDNLQETYAAYHRELLENFDKLNKKESDLALREAEVARKELEYAQHYHQIQEMIQYESALRERVQALQKQKISLQKLPTLQKQQKKPVVKKLIPPGMGKPRK